MSLKRQLGYYRLTKEHQAAKKLPKHHPGRKFVANAIKHSRTYENYRDRRKYG